MGAMYRVDAEVKTGRWITKLLRLLLEDHRIQELPDAHLAVRGSIFARTELDETDMVI